MPAPANGNAPELPVSELTNVKVKRVGADPTSSSNRLDASTLDIPSGGKRFYVDGLPDSGAGAVEGLTTTITCSFLSGAPPDAGSDYTIEGSIFVCTETEIEYAVGDLVKGTATFVSKPPEGS